MHGNGIYGLHVIIQFAECEVLDIFEDFMVQGQGLAVRGQGLAVRGQGLAVRGQGPGVRGQGLAVRGQGLSSRTTTPQNVSLKKTCTIS